MITTEFRNIQSHVASAPKLQVGYNFMQLLRTQGILEAEKGFFPAICGGAVRDGLFTGREINDIDIFLFRDARSASATNTPRTSQQLATEVEGVRQNLLAWLEDEEIEYQSLLSDRAASYFGGQRFTDIIQFTWNDVVIQVMIPISATLSSNLDYLLRTMPIYSGVALTLEVLRMFDTTLASYFLPRNHYFVATERDLPYLRHKFPEGRMIAVSNNREAAMIALSSDYLRTTSVGEVDVTNNMYMASNGASAMCRRACADRLNIGVELLNNISVLEPHSL